MQASERERLKCDKIRKTPRTVVVTS